MTTPDPAFDRRRKSERRSSAAHPLAGELAQAITHGQVEVVYQPQFAAVGGAICGAEALVRWPLSRLGTISGGELFAVAREAGLEHALTRFILLRALQQAARWPQALRLSCNITAADLAAPAFLDSVAAALVATGFDPDRLTLEITEEALLADLDGSAERLRQLVDLGVRVALDDFGAGFCNFRYLKKLPLHYLKLDRSMIEGIGEDPRDLEVLRGIVAMASALDLAVIAEGIETEEQRLAVEREGCETWQGFLGARPMPAEDFAALLS